MAATPLVAGRNVGLQRAGQVGLMGLLPTPLDERLLARRLFPVVVQPAFQPAGTMLASISPLLA